MQEGVHTFESVNGAVAEPVVYMIDQFVVGGFYRVNTDHGVDETEFARVSFVPLAFETDCHTPIVQACLMRRQTASTPMASLRARPMLAAAKVGNLQQP